MRVLSSQYNDQHSSLSALIKFHFKSCGCVICVQAVAVKKTKTKTERARTLRERREDPTITGRKWVVYRPCLCAERSVRPYTADVSLSLSVTLVHARLNIGATLGAKGTLSSPSHVSPSSAHESGRSLRQNTTAGPYTFPPIGSCPCRAPHRRIHHKKKRRKNTNHSFFEGEYLSSL